MKIGQHLLITIASIGERGVGLAKEIGMLKSALLYADEVRLISPLASLYMPMDSFADASLDDELHAFFAMAQAAGLMKDDMQKFYTLYISLSKKKRRTRDELILFEHTRRGLNKAFKNSELWEKARLIADDAGAKHVRRSISEGILRLEELETYDDDLILSYMSSVVTSLFTQNSYPMLDHRTGKLIDAFFQTVVPLSVPTEMVEKSKQTHLNEALLNGLPDFPNASVDEILDIRSELRKYLHNYRAAVIRFSEEIQTIPWSNSFQHEVERIYLKHVTPAIAEISSAVEDSSELRCLARRLQESKTFWSSAFGLIALAMSEVPPILDQAAVIAIGGNTIAELFKTLNDAKQNAAKAQSHPLYYLHQTSKLVKRK